MAANITLSNVAVAADGKTMTATIGGGSGAGFAITDATGLVPHLTTGFPWALKVASVGIIGTTLTIVTVNPFGTGETVKLDILAGSNLTDSGGNTPQGQNNLAVTNNSAVTVRMLDPYTDSNLFEYNCLEPGLSAGGLIRTPWGSNLTSGPVDYMIEFVTDSTDICTLGLVSAASIASIDGANSAAVSGNASGSWVAKPVAAGLAAGKHLIRVSGDFWGGVRIAGGTRSMYTVPTTKRRIRPLGGTFVSQNPATTEVTVYGAYLDNAPDGAANPGNYVGMSLEFDFTGSGVEVIANKALFSVSIDGAQPGHVIQNQTISNAFFWGPLAKGLTSGAHSFRAIHVASTASTGIKGIKIVNGTATTVLSNIGDNTLTVKNVSTLAQYDWVKIDDDATREFRQITNIAGNVITLNSPLNSAHAVGISVTSFSAPAGTISTHARDDLSTKKLLGIGDSNTQGANENATGLPNDGNPDANGTYYSWYDPRVWCGWRAAPLLSMEVVNLGVQGETSGNLVSRKADIATWGKNSIDRVAIWIGTNDIQGGGGTLNITPQNYKDNIEQLILAAQPALKTGGRILLLPIATPGAGPSNTQQNVGGLSCASANAQLQTLAMQYAGTVVYVSDLQADLVSDDYDGVHYKQSGHAKMAERLKPYLGRYASLTTITGAGTEKALALDI